MEDYVAAFRSYEWDDDIERLADRFFVNTPGARHVVLVDESRGSLPIPSRFEKISHTSDTTSYGLPNFPPQSSLWYNVDYGPIILQEHLPGYPYYLLSESDLAVNLSLDVMMGVVVAQRVDFVAHEIKAADRFWDYYENAIGSFKHPWQALLFFMVFSERAVKVLAEGRRSLAVKLAENPGLSWPFCESFVPSQLTEAGMSYLQLAEFADTSMLRFRPRVSSSNPAAWRDGSLVHSVVSPQRFLSALLREHGPRHYFKSSREPDSFTWLDQSILRPTIRKEFINGQDHSGLARFDAENNVTEKSGDMFDLALQKPALSSSTCVWSAFQDPSIDACGANKAEVAEDFGFHTDREDNPWWMVDLLHECVVERVEILNRAVGYDRFRTFSIESSRDKSAWITRYIKFDALEVSWDISNPWFTDFQDPFYARYLRIRLMSKSAILHLRAVRVFGVVVRQAANEYRDGLAQDRAV